MRNFRDFVSLTNLRRKNIISASVIFGRDFNEFTWIDEGIRTRIEIADKIWAADLDPELKEIAAKETEILAQQEHGHGDLVKKILEDHRPELLEVDADPNELMKYLM